eukprot:m.177810 g.177810  ORF g.177810 m.177810 type:complete len:148 (+) comp13551_c0_seq9:375-818(+)
MCAKDARFAVASASCLFRYAAAETTQSLGVKWNNAVKELKTQNAVVAALLSEACLVCSSLWPQHLTAHLVKIGLKEYVRVKKATQVAPKKPKRRQLPSAPSMQKQQPKSSTTAANSQPEGKPHSLCLTTSFTFHVHAYTLFAQKLCA